MDNSSANSAVRTPVLRFEDKQVSAWFLRDIPNGTKRSWSGIDMDHLLRENNLDKLKFLITHDHEHSDKFSNYLAFVRDSDMRRFLDLNHDAKLFAQTMRTADSSPTGLGKDSKKQLSEAWSAVLRAKVNASKEKEKLNSMILVDIQDLD